MKNRTFIQLMLRSRMPIIVRSRSSIDWVAGQEQSAVNCMVLNTCEYARLFDERRCLIDFGAFCYSSL